MLGALEAVLRTIDVSRVLALVAIILSIVNGFILIRIHIRDRAKLVPSPVHPDTYQWWFRLPDSTVDNQPTRAYGFLAYVSIINRGYRAVSLTRWRLRVPQRSRLRRCNELRALSMSEPQYQMASSVKIFPVLGQSGPFHKGHTRVEAGDSTAGMVYYVYECFGHESWDPRVRGDTIQGEFSVHDAFGGRAACRIVFEKKDLEFVKRLVPDIDRIPFLERGDHDLASDSGCV